MANTVEGKPVTIWIPGDVLQPLDELAAKCRLSRSRLCTNLIAVGVEELQDLDAIGMIAAVRAIQALAEKIRGLTGATSSGAQSVA